MYFLAFAFFKKKFNYKSFISLIPFLLILLPHLIWLTENDYITITYGLHRTGAGRSKLSRSYNSSNNIFRQSKLEY